MLPALKRPPWYRRFHFPLLATALALVGIGLVNVASASLRPDITGTWVSAGYATKQLLWCVAALVALAVVVAVPYLKFARAAPGLYGLGLVLLLGVAAAGTTINGSKRWLSLGVTVQPSELVKLAVILMLARHLRYAKNHRTWRGLVLPALILGLPAVLIVRQPDLGTTLVLLPLWLAMLYVAGARRKQLLTLVGAGLVLAPVLYLVALKDYQRARLIAFVDPAAYAQSDGYHVIQSETAIGAGQWFGQGYRQGTQNTLGYLPEKHTDFIFAVIGEEWGFVGAMVVLGLAALLIVQIFLVAYGTREPFGRLVVVGVGVLFAFQTFVNIGMTVGTMPITGLTLPFVSYGGSSLVVCFVALGLVINVRLRDQPTLANDDFHFRTP